MPDLILPPLVPTRPREDGWTPARQRAFLEALAGSGSVAAAARRVGMSRESAYALRRRADARGFAQAWDAARLLAAEHLVDLAWDRAVQGELRPLVYHGEVVAEVRHYDNRLLLGLIAQNRAVLVEQGLVAAPEVTAAVAADWDAALDRVERGEVVLRQAQDERRLEARPAATSAACGDASLTPLPQAGGADVARTAPLPLAGGVGGGPFPAEEEDIPPPLPPGEGASSEAQALDIGLYRQWWDDDRGCTLTNWPAPGDWDGEHFRVDLRSGAATPIAPDPEDPALDSDGAPWPGVDHWARTLAPSEAAGLSGVAEERAARRAARFDIYYRAAFGLASKAERASLAAASGGRWAGVG